jgi:hypothetical protein
MINLFKDINSLKYIRTLEFTDKPDYAYLIEIFSAELENCTFDNPK